MLTITDGKEVDFASMPLAQVAYGNAMDAEFTIRIFDELKDKFKLSAKLYDNLLKRVLVTFAKMERQGLSVNVEALDEIEVSSKEHLDNLKYELGQLLTSTKYAYEDVNFNSKKTLIDILFEEFDLPCYELTKTGLPSTNAEHLGKILRNAKAKKHEPGKEFIKKLLEYVAAEKIHKTYINGLRKALAYNGDGKVYCSYNVGEVVTGRLSCSRYNAGRTKPKGISFHTLPRWNADSGLPNIRSVITSDPGKLFIAADYSQAEVRMLAHCSKDKNLLKAFQEDLDLHKFSASLIFQKDEDEVTEEERQIAKSITFLIMYGGGEYKLHLDTGLPKAYCKEVFERYKNAYPGVFKWIEQVHKFIEEKEVAISLFGRIRHLKDIRSSVKKNQKRALRQGTNFVIQSSTSDLMLFAIQRLQDAIDEGGYDAQILATVHDSVELQTAPECAYEVLEIVHRTMSSTEDIEDLFGFKFSVPFEVDIEIGKSFGELIEVDYSFGSSTPVKDFEIDTMIKECQNLQHQSSS